MPLFLSFQISLIRAKNRFAKNGTANFGRNIPIEKSGPPPEVIPNIPVGRNRNGPFLRKGACIPFTCRFEDTATGCGIHQYILDFSDLFKAAVKTFSETEELYYSIPEEHLSREVISDGFAINHFQVDKLIQLRP